jgi:anthranilate phosphoribosyltransferase
MPLDFALARLSAGRHLSVEEMAAAVDVVMAGRATEAQIAELLTSLSKKGESVDEVVGAAKCLRAHMTPIVTSRTDVVDTCGTGGDGAGTFNISTAAAIVAAAAGVPVAKHGNRAFSSRTGSADVLAELGVNVEAPLSVVAACLEELGLCFCFAPLWHQAIKHVGPVRRRLGTPTIFNLLGPLANPAKAPFQVVGVGRPELRPLLAEALVQLGTRRSIVVHGEDGLDEVTLSGRTLVSEAGPGGTREHVWRPADFGLAESPREALQAHGPGESAAIIRRVLSGRSGPPRDVVVANAAAAIWTAGAAPSLAASAARAAAAIDEGRAARLLDQLAARSMT